MIGIIGAIAEEVNPIKEHMEKVEVAKYGAVQTFQGFLSEKKVVLAQCGIGKVAAAAATQLLIDRFEVKSIIFSGIAGSLDPSLKVGDIVIATKLYEYDAGMLTSEKFNHIGSGAYNKANKLKFFKSYCCDSQLVEVAFKASEALDFPGEKPKILKGPIVTGSQVIYSKEVKEWLYKNFSALAIEMEGAAVAQVASMHNIPFLVIRSISDTVDSPQIDLSQIASYADESTFTTLKRTLKFLVLNPTAILDLIKLNKDIKIAVRHSSLLIVKFVKELLR